MVKRVALVTGAGSGTGPASALSLAAENYAIGALGHRGHELEDVVRKLETNGHHALLYDANISNEGQMHAAVEPAMPVIWPEGQLPITGGRPDRSEDVAEVITFMVWDKARHIAGSPIWVDGGEGSLR